MAPPWIVATLPRRATSGRLRGAGDLPDFVGLDDVALLQVLEVLEADAALEARRHLTHVVLEALERRDRPVPDDGAVAQEAHLRAPRDRAVADVAACHLADPRDRE